MEKVWVAYASESQQFYIELPFYQGMRITDAIEQSKLVEQEGLVENFAFGIFGVKIKDQNQLLSAGDRVEIYRALSVNPKDIRRNRAKANPVGRYCRGNRYQQLLYKS